MGWWSTTIMGGDGPCDVICEFEDICGVEGVFDSNAHISKTSIKTNLTKLIEKVTKLNKEYAKSYNEAGIPGQVLGVFIMSHGAYMSSKARKLILESIDADEWEDSEERKFYIKKFRRQVVGYTNNGRPRKIAEEGLFEVFEKHLKAGKKGLINKNI
jgi:hypothetical protein